ncbi:membrane protein [Carboxydothermus islandicus]|uniref:Diadenylate cyclase n=1 Tax=Carboxydothermus islandicus TaxID=661089 RepID=A0A1L8D3E1_9THEO|nr:diadenylate cyclase CdaA [Carboxydothermus islandicus]GAV25679.1 membrane protein [Carboxydothermus islandicus]
MGIKEVIPYFLTTVLDITIVSFVIYKLLVLIRGSRAESLLKGVVILLLANALAKALGLNTVSWLLKQSMTFLAVALPIVFQPELRRALEQLGRGSLFKTTLTETDEKQLRHNIEILTNAALKLSEQKIGALIVMERNTGLNEYIETGVRLDAELSAELLINIFIPKSPLHDGAVIIRHGRIAAAACFLPLSSNELSLKNLGTRHRAGLGLSEETDAVILIVSEETGVISLAVEGKLYRYLSREELQRKLIENLIFYRESAKKWRF